jgi:cell wall assembly regulator SMI1
MSGATDEDLDAVEGRLGVVLPQDYRALMRARDGLTEDMAEATLLLYSLSDLVAVNEETRGYVGDVLPGALFFGSDGGREQLAWDLRQAEPPVYLVDLTNEGWHDALLQAGSLSALIDRLRSGGTYRWGSDIG